MRLLKGTSGAAVVSNGIVLPPGAVRPGEESKVRLFINGTEQPLYVSALNGRHSDGSLRAVLVQANYTFANQLGVPVTLVYGGAVRATATLAKQPTNLLAAAIIPTSPTYLVSTQAGGPLVPKANTPAALAVLDGDWATVDPQLWSALGASWSRGIAVYEHVQTHYQQYLRTGDPVEYSHAVQMGEAYRAYSESQGGNMSEWNNTTEGLVLHYWLTGDDRVLTQITNQTNWLLGAIHFNYWRTATNLRLQARGLTALLDCQKLGISGGINTYDPPYTAPWNLTGFLDSVAVQVPLMADTSGAFLSTEYGAVPGQKNYMAGLFMTALTRYYDEYKASAPLAATIKKNLDWTYRTQWLPASQAFNYCSVTGGDCTTGPAFGLNGLILPAFGWYYKLSGDATYRTEGDAIALGIRADLTNFVGFPMQFDQSYYRMFNYYARRGN